MIFFLIFVIIPLIEIALFLMAGDAFGILPTLLMCVVTAMIGAALIREQGIHTLFSAKEALGHNELPIKEIFDGICLAVAGALLMTPGFFTDFIGFSLLFPPFRVVLLHYLRQKIDLNVSTKGPYEGHYERRTETKIIEGEFEKLDDDK
jgi:UPF0716 protein FxsA